MLSCFFMIIPFGHTNILCYFYCRKHHQQILMKNKFRSLCLSLMALASMTIHMG